MARKTSTRRLHGSSASFPLVASKNASFPLEFDRSGHLPSKKTSTTSRKHYVLESHKMPTLDGTVALANRKLPEENSASNKRLFLRSNLLHPLFRFRMEATETRSLNIDLSELLYDLCLTSNSPQPEIQMKINKIVKAAKKVVANESELPNHKALDNQVDLAKQILTNTTPSSILSLAMNVSGDGSLQEYSGATSSEMFTLTIVPGMLTFSSETHSAKLTHIRPSKTSDSDYYCIKDGAERYEESMAIGDIFAITYDPRIFGGIHSHSLIKELSSIRTARAFLKDKLGLGDDNGDIENLVHSLMRAYPILPFLLIFHCHE